MTKKRYTIAEMREAIRLGADEAVGRERINKYVMISMTCMVTQLTQGILTEAGEIVTVGTMAALSISAASAIALVEWISHGLLPSLDKKIRDMRQKRKEKKNDNSTRD